MGYLDKIHSPHDFKDYSYRELNNLCDEIRDVIVDTVSKNGGHLASNLGTIELTVAMLKVFPEVENRVVWDVGHQSYTHKILTGRYNQISTIRTQGGLSGFPKRDENVYDAFNVGHSSTSISAAYGIAKAKDLLGLSGYTIAVIGDGALTGGLAYEALNNAGRYKKNFIVVLNDNKMSISKNVGAVARSLSRIRMRPKYVKAKSRLEKILNKLPVVGTPTKVVLKKSKNKVRNMIYNETLFENLGFTYYGPVYGHDLEQLENAFNIVKDVDGPVLLHVITKKGKGYFPAEDDPKNYHGISSFDIDTGEPISSKIGFSDVFGEEICKIAENDDKVCTITAAMQSGTGLNEFASKYKTRFFDVGIAEEHAVTFACGLATANMIPVFAVYSSFLQRCIDQIIHDGASQNLHFVLAIDRAGVVGEDGETHQGLFDVALLNPIPNLQIYSPCYFDELKNDLNKAIYTEDKVVAVRYPRGQELYCPEDFIIDNKSYNIYSKSKANIAIVTYGRLFSYACIAQNELKKCGINLDIIKLNRIKPIPLGALESAKKYEHIFFFEEGMEIGGVGEHFISELNKFNYEGRFYLKGVNNCYVKQASVNQALEKLKLDNNGMVNFIRRKIIGDNI